MSTAHDDPDRMLFGTLVRNLREQRGMSREELGTAIGHTGSTIANIETGYRAPTPAQARSLDKVLGQPGTLEIIEARLRGLPFSAAFRLFAPYEAEATVMRFFANTIAPGLFQEPDYARAILETHPGVTPELVEERLKARMERQRILDAERPPRLWVLLDESVLHREIGSPKILDSQLRRLADLAARPNITIQILTQKTHPGVKGAFVIADTPDRRVGYVETILDGTTTEDPKIVGDLELHFDTLRTEALRGTESLALMERVIDERQAELA